jgi:hypothetical protein
VATNANGFPAHGLYQYSPELFYSVFSERNGFRDTSILLVNTSSPKRWHLIKRPASLKRRNQIPFEEQMLMLVFSTKVNCVDRLNVMQSDYDDDTWTRFSGGNWARKAQDISRWKRVLQQVVNPYVYRIVSQMVHSFEVRRQYKADRTLINPDQVDPGAFVEELTTSVGTGARHEPIEAH